MINTISGYATRSKNSNKTIMFSRAVDEIVLQHLKRICRRSKLNWNFVTSILSSSRSIKWYRIYRTCVFRVCASSVSLVRLKEKPDYYVSSVQKSRTKARASPVII